MSCEATIASCPARTWPGLNEVLRSFNREAEHGSCDTGRYRCRYHIWGSGPPLLMLPGMGADARAFAPLMRHLVEHCRCIAYDLPTGGEDGAHLERYRHEEYVADAVALLDHLHIEQCYLLGVSFGATVALGALQSAPSRVLRAVLQGGFARRRLAPAELALAGLLRHWHIRSSRVPFRNRLLKLCHFAPFANQPEMWDFFLESAGSFPVSVLAQRALLLHQVDLRPSLPAIRQPVLVVTGDTDTLVSAACADELLQCLPNAGQVRLQHCGHYAQFTHTAELADLIIHFLTPRA